MKLSIFLLPCFVCFLAFGHDQVLATEDSVHGSSFEERFLQGASAALTGCVEKGKCSADAECCGFLEGLQACKRPVGANGKKTKCCGLASAECNNDKQCCDLPCKNGQCCIQRGGDCSGILGDSCCDREEGVRCGNGNTICCGNAGFNDGPGASCTVQEDCCIPNICKDGSCTNCGKSSDICMDDTECCTEGDKTWTCMGGTCCGPDDCNPSNPSPNEACCPGWSCGSNGLCELTPPCIPRGGDCRGLLGGNCCPEDGVICGNGNEICCGTSGGDTPSTCTVQEDCCIPNLCKGGICTRCGKVNDSCMDDTDCCIEGPKTWTCTGGTCCGPDNCNPFNPSPTACCPGWSCGPTGICAPP